MSEDSENDRRKSGFGVDRRTALKSSAAGLGLMALSAMGSGSVAAKHGAPHGNAKIDPYFGYASAEDQDLSGTDLEPQHTVELHYPSQHDSQGPIPFHFSPMGLHVEKGDIIRFDFKTPDHTVTPYHLEHGRQQRVPRDAKPFSAPVIRSNLQTGEHGFWLYEFNSEGIYDLYCAPHEFLAMVMRVVVGDTTSKDFFGEDDFSDVGRGPFTDELKHLVAGDGDWLLPTAAEVFETDALSVSNIVADDGKVYRKEVIGSL